MRHIRLFMLLILFLCAFGTGPALAEEVAVTESGKATAVTDREKIRRHLLGIDPEAVARSAQAAQAAAEAAVAALGPRKMPCRTPSTSSAVIFWIR